MIVVLLSGEHYRQLLKRMMGRTYNPWPLIFFTVTFPIILGLLLAIPHIIGEFKKEGKWLYDWIIFWAVQIPTFYIIFILPIMYLPVLSPLTFLYPRYLLIIVGQQPVLTVVGMAAGYISLAALHK
ncbi:MAG: hypothetical protein NUK65_12935 [Firmicutes bacterium]|nr:hypothetical protein [Bacillota bacterium]